VIGSCRDGERETDSDEAFLRRLVLPEEDRLRLHPTVQWTGGFRWFRSSNVIPMEQWRRQPGGCGANPGSVARMSGADDGLLDPLRDFVVFGFFVFFAAAGSPAPVLLGGARLGVLNY